MVADAVGVASKHLGAERDLLCDEMATDLDQIGQQLVQRLQAGGALFLALLVSPE